VFHPTFKENYQLYYHDEQDSRAEEQAEAPGGRVPTMESNELKCNEKRCFDPDESRKRNEKRWHRP
jgi:hypothetical protein